MLGEHQGFACFANQCLDLCTNSINMHQLIVSGNIQNVFFCGTRDLRRFGGWKSRPVTLQLIPMGCCKCAMLQTSVSLEFRCPCQDLCLAMLLVQKVRKHPCPFLSLAFSCFPYLHCSKVVWSFPLTTSELYNFSVALHALLQYVCEEKGRQKKSFGVAWIGLETCRQTAILPTRAILGRQASSKIELCLIWKHVTDFFRFCSF